MGVYHKIYLAAGVKIPNQYRLYESAFYTCGEHLCSEHDLYCRVCGKPVNEQREQKQSLVHPEDIIGTDSLHCCFDEEDKDNMYLLSNRGHGVVNDFEANRMVKIDCLLIANMKIDFRVNHSQDLLLLEQETGLKPIVDFYFFDSYR